MKVGEDAMKISTKCIVMKRNKKMRAGTPMQAYDCAIVSSVTAGVVNVDIPEKNIMISIRTQDLLAAMNAANQKYLGLRQNELGTSLVED